MFLRALPTSPSSSSGTRNAIGSLLDGFPSRWPIWDTRRSGPYLLGFRLNPVLDRTTHGILVDRVLEALSEKQHAPTLPLLYAVARLALAVPRSGAMRPQVIGLGSS